MLSIFHGHKYLLYYSTIDSYDYIVNVHFNSITYCLLIFKFYVKCTEYEKGRQSAMFSSLDMSDNFNCRFKQCYSYEYIIFK